jgi:hypothetical protein
MVKKKEEEIKQEKTSEEIKKTAEYSKRGKSNRAKGQRFEAKVRQNLEELGWVVGKWTNTVDYDKNAKAGKIVPAKRKYNPFSKVLTIGTGFPDFICFRRNSERNSNNEEDSSSRNFEVIGLEVKGNGYLDQIEKGMCFWLLKNKIFSRILIAKKTKTNDIEYIDFLTKYKDNEELIEKNNDISIE